MSFNKRYITKEKIINAVMENKVDRLFNADSLIMDDFCSKFYHNYYDVNKRESAIEDIKTIFNNER